MIARASVRNDVIVVFQEANKITRDSVVGRLRLIVGETVAMCCDGVFLWESKIL